MSEEEQEKGIPLEFCVQAILQLYKNKVFSPQNILLFLCNRGREDVREMYKKNDF